MESKDADAKESDRERFEKNLAALLVVPKPEIAALENQRVKKGRRKQKKHG